MIKLEHVVLASPEQIEFIIEGMRNPMKCIEHCATARAYGRFREAGVMTKMDDVAAGIVKSKEEKDNVEKRFN